MKSRLALALLALFLSLPAPPVHAGSDGLMDLYLLAKAKDPVLGRAHAQVELSRAERQIVGATLLPRIDAGASINWIANKTLFYQPQTINGSFTGDSYSVTLRQPLLYLPGVYNLRAAGASLEGAGASEKGAGQDLMVNLAEAYFTLLKGRSDEQLYLDDTKRLRQVLVQAEAYLTQGTGDIIAVYEARARLDGAAADQVKASNIRRTAEQKLASLVGRPVTNLRDLPFAEARGPEPADLNWWLSAMEKNQPNLLQARAGVRQAEEERKAARAGHLPSIQLNGGYAVSKGSTFLPEVETRQWSVGLNFSLPIYTGGDTAARIRRAVANEEEQRYGLGYALEQVTQKLKDSFQNLQYNGLLIKALQQKRSSAELQLKAVLKGRSIGSRTISDLLNAEQSLAVSRRDLSAACYDNVLDSLHLKAAAGLLAEGDLREINALLTSGTTAALTAPADVAPPRAKGETP